jgi:hypothetical protein
MQIGDVVNGYEDQHGIYLNTIVSVGVETVGLSVIEYKPGEEGFDMAIIKLNEFVSKNK